MDGLAAKRAQRRQALRQISRNAVNGMCAERRIRYRAQTRRAPEAAARPTPGAGPAPDGKIPARRDRPAPASLQARQQRYGGGELRQQLPRKISHQTGRIGCVARLHGADPRRAGWQRCAARAASGPARPNAATRAPDSPSPGTRLEIDDLQHIFVLIGGAQMKIAVALAGQRTNRSGKPIGVARDAFGLRNREDRRRGPQRQEPV